MSLGSDFSGRLGKIANDAGIGVEEVITGHSGLPRHTSGDDDDLCALECLLETSIVLAGSVTRADGGGIDVGDVSRHTFCEADIEQSELGDERVVLEQQREGLANSTGCTEDCDVLVGGAGGAECTGCAGGGAEDGACKHAGQM